ncbi:MAG: glycosyltransferase [Bacillota bacterium]|nr:glycosyltransferase [Bacillota bacterium]
MIKVLQIGMSENPGGIENLVMNYYRKINKDNFSFDFLDIYGQGVAFSSEIENLGGKVFSISDVRKHPATSFFKIRQIVKLGEYDVVHLHVLSAANIVPFLAVKSLPCKIVIHSHNTSTGSYLKRVLHNINAHVLQRSRATRVACGEAAGHWLWNDKDFIILPNAIDLSRYSFDEQLRKRIRNELNVDDKFVFGFMGRLTAQKDPFVLIDLAHKLSLKANKFVFLVVGTGELAQQFKDKVTADGVEQYFIICNPTTDVRKYYCAMDCLVLPSKFEGLPMVIIEAQANNLPSLISNSITTEVDITTNVQRYNDFDDLVELSLKRMTNQTRIDECYKINETVFSINQSINVLESLYSS